MNESNSKHQSTFIGICMLMMVLFSATFTPMMAQTPSCACKGAIQISVDQNCEAVVTSDMILASGSTCGGTSTAIVTLMKTPTGGVIDEGVGSADLEDASLYIGKTIYGKVSTADRSNSCWTTIKVEDKLKPTWEDDDPIDIVVTCPGMSLFVPEAEDNCHTPKVTIVSETIIVNDCENRLFAGPDTLKLITRRYQAIDEAGNVSETECVVNFWVVGLDTDGFIRVPNVGLECDQDYAKLPNGHPSPTPIKVGNVTKLGSGVPLLFPWMPMTTGNGQVNINSVAGNIKLIGGTTGVAGTAIGAQVCIKAQATGNITFSWAAFKTDANNNYVTDNVRYTINGGAPVNILNTNVAGPAITTLGTATIPVLKDDVLCIQVMTDNTGGHTDFTMTNIAAGPGIPLTPEVVTACNIYTTFDDTPFPAIKCVQKIMRKWQIIEWSCDSKVQEFTQIIEIRDSKGPVITDLVDATASTNGHTCEGIFRLQKPKIVDNCSATVTYDVTYPGGFLKGLKLTDSDKIIPLPLGCNEVTYTAFDDCHNQNTVTIEVYVEDNTPPVAICDLNTTVGLTLDGKAWVPATSFDDGSYDDCDLAKVLVRRMDPANCRPCKTPEFPGFTHLGEYVNRGRTAPHYYYISKHKATPAVAFKTAKAMGGDLVAINTAAEDEWLYDQVALWNLDEDYLIGLRDVKRKFDYRWSNGDTSRYRNWLTDDVVANLGTNKNEFVRVSSRNGEWIAFGSDRCEEDEYLYVVEITDPCGFSAYAQFCCTDVRTSPHQVILRAIDKSGNWNECMVNTIVQDKLPPSITCPEHMTVNCNTYFDTGKLRHTFGWPTFYDNCDNVRITQDSVIDLNSCRIGTITRTFTAEDPGGRRAVCTQTITVIGHERPFEMDDRRWPRDTTITACEDPNDAAFGIDRLGRPNLTADNICSLVGAEFEDQIFTFNNSNGDACFKILRNWTVIDWCQRRLTDGGGYTYRTWTHTQVIKVGDKRAPRITSSCAPKKVCTYDPTCTDGFIELIATATDSCTRELRYSYKIDAFNDGSFESGLSKSGLGNSATASGRYPVGTHLIVWSFEDRCGNVTKCEQLFSIVNCKAPTPYCLNGLATSLMPMDADNNGIPESGMVEIWAKDFDNNSSHPCPGYSVVHSFRPVTAAADGTPVIVRGRIYTCDSLGRRNVNIYVAALDKNGKVILDDNNRVVQDFCSTFITIQDNFKVCRPTSNRFVINGTTETETNEPVKGVVVDLQGSEMSMMTGNDGVYNFNDLSSGSNYVVKPGKNDDYLNGVTTLDLVKIQRHILSAELLNSPYKLIAADVNNDQKITAADLSELRKLILGIYDQFPNNKSWRFVDKNYVFFEPANAHAEKYPEIMILDNINTDKVVDFKAVKIGDVNNNVEANANSNGVEGRSNNAFALRAENVEFKAEQSIQVPVTVATNTNVSGFQFTVHFDTDLFNLEAINGGLIGMTDQNFGFTKLANGVVTVSYNRADAMDLDQAATVFTLTLKAKQNGSLADGLWLSSEVTKAEAYTADFNVMKVDFEMTNNVSDQVVLHQNTPNPFKAVSTIGFELPQTMIAKITIYDLTGKTVKTINETFNKGYNSIEINKNELGSTGVLYYTLEVGDFKATKKMVVIE